LKSFVKNERSAMKRHLFCFFGIAANKMKERNSGGEGEWRSSFRREWRMGRKAGSFRISGASPSLPVFLLFERRVVAVLTSSKVKGETSKSGVVG